MVKNHLKSVKDITAPLNWQSSPDSPSTQLAYVTQDEIDMMVDANIHGSMDGKPNVGPKGIISLDGGTVQDRAYDEAVDKSGNEAAIDQYYSSDRGQEESKTSDTSQDIINKVSDWQKDTNQGGQNIKTSQKKQAKATKEIYKDIQETEKAGLPEEKKKTPIEDYWRKFTGLPEKKWVQGTKLNLPGLGPTDVSRAAYNAYHKMLSLTRGNKEKALQAAADAQKRSEFSKEHLVTMGTGGLEKLIAGTLNPLKKFEKAEYENEFLGSAGAANILNKLNSLPEDKKRAFIDQVIAANPEGYQELVTESFEKGEADMGIFNEPGGFSKEFERLLVQANQGNKNFDKNYHGTRENFFMENVPQTQGGLEELARLSMTGLTNSPEDRRLSYEIQQARDAVFEQADRADQMSGRAATGGEYWTGDGGGGGGEPPPDDETPPGDENQWMTADAGKIGKYNPNINPATGMPWGYQWGTMDEYSPYAEVNLNLPFAQARNGGIVGLYNGGYLNDSNGVIGLDGGGYLNDYRAADSLMFKDPQEDEEWEYNV